MAIGKRITERLAQLGWERKELLDRVYGLTPQALSNLITRDSARSEWDEKIADALGVSVLWLVYGRQENPSEATGGSMLHARERAATYGPIGQIIAAAERLSYEGQLVAVGRLEELIFRYPPEKKEDKQ